MHEKSELDQLIDSALATYAVAEDQLKERILARVTEAHAAKRLARRRMWMLAIAVPAAACLLLLIMMPRWHERTGPKGNSASNPALAQNVPVAPTAGAPASVLPRHEPANPPRKAIVSAARSAAPRTARNRSLPKLDVFPTPQPLSPEEQALISFATQATQEQRNAVLDAQQNREAPLAIASIRIPPIAPPDEGKN